MVEADEGAAVVVSDGERAARKRSKGTNEERKKRKGEKKQSDVLELHRNALSHSPSLASNSFILTLPFRAKTTHVSWISVATEQSICARHSATSLPLDTGSDNGVANAFRPATRSATKPPPELALAGVEEESPEEDAAAAAGTAVGGEARSRRGCG